MVTTHDRSADKEEVFAKMHLFIEGFQLFLRNNQPCICEGSSNLKKSITSKALDKFFSSYSVPLRYLLCQLLVHSIVCSGRSQFLDVGV